MPAAKYDMIMEAGATFTRSLILRNSDNTLKDLTNHTARMEVRQYHFSDTVLLTGSTVDGKLVLNIPTSTIVISFPASETALLDVKRAVYDIELVNALGEVTRLLEGVIVINPEVTRL